MANTRIFHENLLQDAVLDTVQYQGTGAISGVIKEGSGSAVMVAEPYGSGYNSYNTLLYTVNIYDVTGGVEVGQAKFRWRTNDMAAGTWLANETTSTSAIPIGGEGVQVRWVQGTGADFVLGDTFYFTGIASNSIKHAYDNRRDRKFVAAASDAHTLIFDLGSAHQARVCAIFDAVCDFSKTVYARLSAGGTSACPNLMGTFDTSTDPMILYFDGTYRYWKLWTQFTSSVDLSIGQIILADYTELPAGAMFNWGSRLRRTSDLAGDDTDQARRVLANRRELDLTWKSVSAAHRALFDGLYDACRATADGVEHPVFVHLFPDIAADEPLWMKLSGNYDREWVSYGRDGLTLNFREVAASYVV